MNREIINKEIAKCQESLADLYRVRIAMQKNLHLADNDPALDHIAEKSWKFVFKWEVYAYCDPENRAGTERNAFSEN